MIAPNCHLRNIVDGATCFLGDLCLCPVVIETHHGGEVAWIDIWGVTLSDQSVGIGWISDYEYFYVFAGVVVDGLTLN